MNFVYPGFLYALSLIAIPIIIHLFNFRRYKTVYFTNVKFLQEVKEETAVKSKLKHWLVLISRILAVIFLVLAFAQPVIPVSKALSGSEGNRGISVYIDNSFSMNAKADEESLLNKAKRKALEVAKAYGEGDRFQLITNDFDARQKRFVSREEFLGMIDEITLSAQVRSLRELYSIQKKSFEDAAISNRLAYWISDFQKDIVNFQPDTILTVNMIPLQALEQHNLFIDSAWLDKPVVHLDLPNRIFARIRNSSDKEVNGSRLNLSVNNQVKAISDFSVRANSYAIDTVIFTVKEPGWKSIELSIIDYPITFDDKYFMTVNVTEQVSVLAINEAEESVYLKALYSSAEKFVYENQFVNQLDYSSLGNFSLIVLNNLLSIPSGLSHELNEYIAKGGAITIFPNAKSDVESYNKFFKSVRGNPIVGLQDQENQVTLLSDKHELFNDVFEEVPQNVSLPKAIMYYKFGSQVQSSEQVLLGFRNRNSFVSHYNYKYGSVFVCASPLDVNYSDFPIHALFVPMLYKMALAGGGSGKTSYTMGSDAVIEVENKITGTDEIYKMKGGENEFIPQQKAIGPKVLLILDNQISKAGVYKIFSKDEIEHHLVALNYSRKESELDCYSGDELKDLYPIENIKVIDAVKGSITQFVKELDKGIVLWKLCIIFALIFLGVEVLFLRFLP